MDYKKIPLDNINLNFLTEYYDENQKVRSYSIDIENADDCHYDFQPESFERLKLALEKKYKKGDCVKNLKALVKKNHNKSSFEWELSALLAEEEIPYMRFSY